MNKKTSFHFQCVLWVSMIVTIVYVCGEAHPTDTPTPQWKPMPTYTYNVLPSDVSEYTHFAPSEGFKIHLKFEYPSYWWLQENIDEIALRDPRFLTLPTPFDDMHPTPNDLGSVYIWIMPSEPGQTPDTELASHKQAYSETHWMKILKDYKITIDGSDASVLEYQVDDSETSPSLMFYRRMYFMVNKQVYEIIFSISENDRGGEFEQGFEHLINTLKVVTQ
jgi:hypothetical protein